MLGQSLVALAIVGAVVFAQWKVYLWSSSTLSAAGLSLEWTFFVQQMSLFVFAWIVAILYALMRPVSRAYIIALVMAPVFILFLGITSAAMISSS